MDSTHIHLLITHLPIFGSILGAFVLAYGIWAKSNSTKIAAYNVFIISAIGAGIAYLTGEAAEETAENIQGISETIIEQHEEFALFGLISLIVLGLSSIAGLFLIIRKYAIAHTAALIILLLSLISFGLIARTGYIGGQIRHTEINSNTTSTSTEVEDDD